MSELVLVTGAAGGSQGSTGRRVTSPYWKEGFRCVPSYINWMRGPMFSGNSVRKLCKEISLIGTLSALLSQG
jgi:hypothetical protein